MQWGQKEASLGRGAPQEGQGLVPPVMSQNLHQPQHVAVAVLGIDVGAAVHNAAHFAPRQLLGGMLAGEHHVDEHPQGLDVGADVRLGQAVLLRGGKAGGAQNLGIVAVLGFM